MYARPLGPDATLSPLEPWQAEEFLANLDRCRDHISPWVGASFVAVDLEAAERVLGRYWERQARTGGGIHGIRVDGVLVGGVMFVSVDTATGEAEIGVWVETAAEGRGLVTRAAALLIDWGFRERGLRRIVWHTLSDNKRGIAVAQRLGFTFEATDEASEIPMEFWTIGPDAWLGTRPDAPEMSDEEQVDALGEAFLGAFTNAGGRTVDLPALLPSFAPGAVIISHGDPVKHESPEEFLTPRQALLTGGELTDFREWTTSRSTVVSGNVAQRLVRYAKSGMLRGAPLTGGGTKSMQFVRTADGWRISAITLADDSTG
ncbi:GNAT family N-acetyltransferase [Yinghuangia soli]|uniref:GNAT family N-acetyltransferase n=1 Tax=Yinghuangia soli TaxID=2908204 RepID=A0AA41TZ90_9ACTN|nr:GNAT family protein [Yinghuangia soli]MCF2527025.1 GNAT family N-acetyltransferase [Yinghuangia soli]